MKNLIFLQTFLNTKIFLIFKIYKVPKKKYTNKHSSATHKTERERALQKTVEKKGKECEGKRKKVSN